MIILKPIELEWVDGAEDDPSDQCAHAKVDFQINGTKFVVPEDSWTVSASALYLLRTIEYNHDSQINVCESNFMFPCCGFNPYIVEGKFDLMIMGCNSGINIYVEHRDNLVTIKSIDENIEEVTLEEWREAVSNFAMEIKTFYSSNQTKHELIDVLDKEGWAKFWDEFNTRLDDAKNC